MKLKNTHSLFLFFLFVIPTLVNAQSTDSKKAPHDSKFSDTGIIEGRVFTKDKSGKEVILSNHKVTIIIYKGDRPILTLDKNTDDKGAFQFKNIIKTEDFTYEFGTMYQDHIYVHPKVGLKENENSKKINFWIGEGSPYKKSMEELAKMRPQQTPPSNVMPPKSQHNHPIKSDWDRPFKIYTGILCALVLGAALYFAVIKK